MRFGVVSVLGVRGLKTIWGGATYPLRRWPRLSKAAISGALLLVLVVAGSNAYILLVPFLRAIARLPPHVARTLQVPLGKRIASAANRHQFYTVRVRDGVAYPAFKGSGDITSLSRADGYIEIPSDQSTVEEATLVDVFCF